MSAERSTDSIIDLLYGELSEEETAEMRKELGESAELEAELTTYQDLLDRVRESMPIEEVSPYSRPWQPAQPRSEGSGPGSPPPER